MKVVIWGCGERGKRIFSRLKKEDVIAFIDGNPQKIGKEYLGKRIISFEEYLDRYAEEFILISIIRPAAVEKKLLENGIHHFFSLTDCPSELQGVRQIENFNEILDRFRSDKVLGILGTTFYSVYFYEYLKEKGSPEIYIIPEKDKFGEKVTRLREKGIEIYDEKRHRDRIEKVYVTIDGKEEIQGLKASLRPDIVIEDVYDLSRKIEDYRNLKIEKFRNSHYGERCFIVATGPSLKMEDLAILKESKSISISMNRVYKAFDSTDWRPDYYMVADWRCIEESGQEILGLDIKNKFISDVYPPFWKQSIPDNVYQYHCHFLAGTEKMPSFSEDFTYGAYSYATVTYDCIQLAVYMGFKEIYLLGVDFSFSEDYKNAGNHFVSNYYAQDSKASYFLKEESLAAYRAAKQYADKHGIKIYNATRGGKLEVFERVDFDSLFEEDIKKESVE